MVDMANAARVGEELKAAFGTGVGVVVADLSGTWFCGSSGIHALVMAYQRAQASGTELRVVAGPGRVRRGAGTIAPGHGACPLPAAGYGRGCRWLRIGGRPSGAAGRGKAKDSPAPPRRR